MMNVLIKLYDKSKYEVTSKVVAKGKYKNIKGFEVKIMSDNDIYSLGFDEVDPNNEYLIITLNSGETSTFRNSFIDLFRI